MYFFGVFDKENEDPLLLCTMIRDGSQYLGQLLFGLCAVPADGNYYDHVECCGSAQSAYDWLAWLKLNATKDWFEQDFQAGFEQLNNLKVIEFEMKE